MNKNKVKISFSVEELELNELKQLALSKKMTVAQYIRFCVEQDKKFSKPIPKSSMKSLLIMLQKEAKLIADKLAKEEMKSFFDYLMGLGEKQCNLSKEK